MKTGLTLQQMGLELQRQKDAKADYLVNTGKLAMEGGDGIFARILNDQGVDEIEPLEMLPTAHSQIGTYLGIPSKYYDKMLAEDTDLLAYNINRWFQKNPEQRMLRTMDGHIRAFLSNRYRRIDNLDVMTATLPILAEIPDARFESCNLSDDYLFIKVVNPRLQAEVVPGDIVQAGIVISNSETGLGAVNIQPLVYRLVCKNGMVVNAARTRRHHVGRVASAEENFSIYREETLAADDKAFIMKIQDAVRAAVDEAKFSMVVDAMRESTGVKLSTKDLPGLVKMAGSEMGITEAERAGVLQHLIEGHDFTLYGLANAVTRYSQDVEDYDRATKLEEIGYSVLTMHPALIARLNQLEPMALAA